jgi:NRAMP (natural resistance-associated macrophage protein)-like metal ion transporter
LNRKDVTPAFTRRRRWRFARLGLLAAMGPGIISGFADNDAGGITTYSVVGAKFGYEMMWVLLVSAIALGLTQEAGARLGLATGKGLLDLIRERFGLRWSALGIGTMLLANLGDTVSEFAGISAALLLFGVSVWLSNGLATMTVIVLLTRGSFRRVQMIFLAMGGAVSIGYAIDAYLAHPAWGTAAFYLVAPHGALTSAYLLAVVGTIGTTITPWGQGFIQSYTADKGLSKDNLIASRIDIITGAVLTNLIAAFIVVATAATLYAHGDTNIPDAAHAAMALRPFAGRFAEIVFAFGLLGASLLGLGTVPLTSAYSTCEAIGIERGLTHSVKDARGFYGLLTFFIGIAAALVFIPGLPLIQVMFLSQVFDGLLLPIILVFVMLLSTDRWLLGDLASGRVLKYLGWFVTIAMSVLSVALVISLFVPF